MILDRIPVQDSPDWMNKLDLTEPVNLRPILNNSLFYPCSALHGEPIFTWRHHLQCFVYSDIGYSIQEARDSLHHKTRSVKGYAVTQERELEVFEPSQRTIPAGPLSHENSLNSNCDDVTEPIFRSRSRNRTGERRAAIFKLQRKPDFSDRHGPKTLLLIYVSADSTEAYKKLYWRNEAAAKVVAIIQPGPGDFRNKNGDFRNQNGDFGQAVLENRYGIPKYLMCGGSGTRDFKACWPRYSRMLVFWTSSSRCEAGVWKRR